MGSPFNIILVADDSLRAVALAGECFALVDSFNRVFSDYDPNSELNQLNTTAGSGVFQRVSPALWEMILRSKKAFQKSTGAFDITVGPLSQLWRKVRKLHQFPSVPEITKARNSVGFKKILIRTAEKKIKLPVAGMRLDLGGIAKGFIAQQVINYLAKKGITHALADAGGDMVMSGPPPGTQGWVIGVNIPETTEALLPRKLLLHHMAVATSGDAYQYFEHAGKKYSHIIDPRTGYGIVTQRNVTVIAADGSDADWLATACSILPIAAARRLAGSMHAELLITELKAGKITAHSTPGFERYWRR